MFVKASANIALPNNALSGVNMDYSIFLPFIIICAL